MRKKIRIRRSKLKAGLALIICIFGVAFLGQVMNKFNDTSSTNKKVEASTVVTTGDFRLTADNKWDNSSKVNYVDLNWTSIPDLNQSGYQLYQSEDGITWNARSLNYGKSIKVLNIYPDVYATNIKDWMDDPAIGKGLIDVTPVSITNFNANPLSYLKDGSGDYIYDVVFFGTANANNNKALVQASADALTDFLDAGRGVLVGHDVVSGNGQGFGGLTADLTYSNLLVPYLGIGLINQSSLVGYPGSIDQNGPTSGYPISATVTIKNDGYLMKYPHELENGKTFTIPLTHSFGQVAGSAYGGTLWLEFTNYTISNGTSFYDTATATANFYLVTENNAGMIQTGHSNGAAEPDEQRIIANTLYNLAQVSLDNAAQDYSVKDDKAPNAPKASIRCGNNNNLNIKIDTTDVGKDYQWYVDANTKSNGVLSSDVVQETVTSNIAGYFYEVSNSPTSTLQAQVNALKDGFGRIAESDYDIYIAPGDNSTVYETATTFTIAEERVSGRYLHVVAVDRSNNVSNAAIYELDSILQYVDFEVERTGDEAKLINVNLDSSVGGLKKAIEIQIPINSEIKDFASLSLPTGWYAFENSATSSYRSFTFAIETKNDLATIQTFLEDLRITMTSSVNQSGDIRIVFQEKVYTSYEHADGKIHYYTFVPANDTWFNAYNQAKQMQYKGMAGYLSTLTSEDEHDFMFNNIAKNPGWLGGTRAKLNSTGKIDDASNISTTVGDYDLSGEDWYWVNGPEALDVFYIGKTRATGTTPAGKYSNWGGVDEPNNGSWYNGSILYTTEYALQFALYGTKYWNDLPGELIDAPVYSQGFYVEFSEYGTQVEGIEITDVCWSASVPQKVSLEAYDDQGNRLSDGDLLYDQALVLGKTETVTPVDLPLYDFKELTDTSGVSHGLSYTISDTYQQGKLIYTYRGVTIHVRQVIANAHAELVIPTTGYGYFESANSASVTDEQFSMKLPSSELNTLAFKEYLIRYQAGYSYYTFVPVMPEYYQLVGYMVTYTSGSGHTAAGSSVTPIVVDVSQDEEFWLTVYLEPSVSSTDSPGLYAWDYKLNDFGTIDAD